MLNDNNFFSGGAGTGFYPTEINQSLRFNDDDSAYLSWTPASAGNRKTWTFSTWVKRTEVADYNQIFSFGYNNPDDCSLRFRSNDVLEFTCSASSVVQARYRTNAVYRDVSAWYHIVLAIDTTQATASNRVKLFVNGEQVTSFSSETVPAQNAEFQANTTYVHEIGRYYGTVYPFDGYLAETHFIDGTAYDATAFGEFKNGVWIPKTADVTYGTNGFYLPYRNDYTVEGFSTVTWTGDGSSDRYIGGVGFKPDLIWTKSRGSSSNHNLVDSVRGIDKRLFSHSTIGEVDSAFFASFENDGFMLDNANDNDVNASGGSYVAWCWDAGTGSPVSNTDGSITSTVKANPDRGFSIVSYTGTGSAATIGHGLSSAPDMWIVKQRNGAQTWYVGHTSMAATEVLSLELTSAKSTNAGAWNSTYPTSSVINVATSAATNGSGNTYIAYCFHSVSGYSKDWQLHWYRGFR